MLILQITELKLAWHKYEHFCIAYLSASEKDATGYTAFIKVTDYTNFWGTYMDEYLDALNERNCVGPVLFDIRNTPKETPDDFMELYCKYRQFWLKGIRVLDAWQVRPVIDYFDRAVQVEV